MRWWAFLLVTDAGQRCGYDEDKLPSHLTSNSMTNILDQILATKRGVVTAAKQQTPETNLRRQLENAPPPRDFAGALRAVSQPALIAEVKKASPSAGLIRADFDPVAIAECYAEAGATCLSILTDVEYFQGDLDYLRQIRAAVPLPLLRKDFVVDPYQVLEARAAGADAVLLIAECLPGSLLPDLHGAICDFGMTPLVELYDPENLPRVLACGAQVIGVNNRNLKTFEVDLNHVINLRQEIPADRLLVAESGIKTNEDVKLLRSAGINAMLVGESLMRQADIAEAVRSLLG
jgi:indole-3-glycerol phosphate synthase